MKYLVDVIIPTFNAPEMLASCVNSIRQSLGSNIKLVKILIVNNGHKDIEQYFPPTDGVELLFPGENLRWEGGLKYALERSDSPFVIFCNDDIRMVNGDKMWLWKMGHEFNDPTVAAVGPCSNYVMGAQSIFVDQPARKLEVPFLIGFFMMLRRSDLEAAGGVDDTLPGGDDIDLSIRLKDLGKRLLCVRDTFVFHHGERTGRRVLGDYWNSAKMQEDTNLALIRKHGMKKFWETMVMGPYSAKAISDTYAADDREGELCRQHVKGKAVLEVGCGGLKTVENAVGIDAVKYGDPIPYVTTEKGKCIGDLQGDASRSLPVSPESQDTIIARHLLEHCQDPLGTLSMWNNALKQNGLLIIAVPHNGLGQTILMNPEHIMSFTPASLTKLARACGFVCDHTYEDVNGTSFVSVFRKVKPSIYSEPEKTVSPLAARLEVSCA